MGPAIVARRAEGRVAVAVRAAEGLRVLDPLPPCSRAVPRGAPCRATNRRTRGGLPPGGAVPQRLIFCLIRYEPRGGDGARPMIKRALGSTGLAVSALGLGCNNFGGRLDLEKTKAVVDAAIEAGVNFIDTADAYGNFGGSETLLGVTLGSRRKNLILATQFCRDRED